MLPTIHAVVRSCHGRVCTIRFLLGMQQLLQLLPAFESRQKIDLLNSISLIFLRSSANNLKKLTAGKFRDKFDCVSVQLAHH